MPLGNLSRAAMLVLLLPGVAAHAQRSVSGYGRLGHAVEYMNGLADGGGGRMHRFRVRHGDWSSTFLGVRGAEALGGGQRLVFRLEATVDSATGRVGGESTLFNRWATLGLASSAFGTVLIGRESAIANKVWDFDPLGQTSWSSASLVRGRNWPGSCNNVSYQSPMRYGLDTYAQYGLSNARAWNGDGSTGRGRSAGIALTYAHAIWRFRVMYDEIRNPANGRFDDVFRYSREYFGGVNLMLGRVRWSVAYQCSHAGGAPVANRGVTRTRHVWGGAVWHATPAATLRGAVYHVKSNRRDVRATLYALGGTYALSRRTQLNAQVGTVCNGAAAEFGLGANRAGPGGPATGGVNANPGLGACQTGVFAGVQHVF